MKKKTLFLTIIILLSLLFLWVTDYQCPVLFLFGIPCPFCGMTRAFLSVLQGNFLTAFYFHPLWPVVFVVFVLFVLVKLKLLHLSDKCINNGALIIAILFLLCFLIRHITHSPVVQPDITKGFLYSLKNAFKKGL